MPMSPTGAWCSNTSPACSATRTLPRCIASSASSRVDRRLAEPAVHRFDLVRVSGVDTAPLQLRRRRQEFAVRQPLLADERELLDLLDLSELLVDLVDAPLHFVAHFRVGREVAQRRAAAAVF